MSSFTREEAMGKDSRDIIRELQVDGWQLVGTSGSHHHLSIPGKRVR
jgi:predicted RNA binding protein YcfA (HicA-like mRNA interferase family)